MGWGQRGMTQGQKLQSQSWARGRTCVKASRENLRNEALSQRPLPRQGLCRPSAQAPAPACPLLLSLQTQLGCRARHLPEKPGAHRFECPGICCLCKPRGYCPQRMLPGRVASEGDFGKEPVMKPAGDSGDDQHPAGGLRADRHHH